MLFTPSEMESQTPGVTDVKSDTGLFTPSEMESQTPKAILLC